MKYFTIIHDSTIATVNHLENVIDSKIVFDNFSETLIHLDFEKNMGPL